MALLTTDEVEPRRLQRRRTTRRRAERARGNWARALEPVPAEEKTRATGTQDPSAPLRRARRRSPASRKSP